MPPRILTGDAALRREARLQQREDRLSTKTADLKAEVLRLREALINISCRILMPQTPAQEAKQFEDILEIINVACWPEPEDE